MGQSNSYKGFNWGFAYSFGGYPIIIMGRGMVGAWWYSRCWGSRELHPDLQAERGCLVLAQAFEASKPTSSQDTSSNKATPPYPPILIQQSHSLVSKHSHR